ncbi:MAG: hypothetical protein OSB69_11940 [Alphaproteobacteria bacterium]|nr:hypothetical protein [Alphaproteobacteria bacterium]
MHPVDDARSGFREAGAKAFGFDALSRSDQNQSPIRIAVQDFQEHIVMIGMYFEKRLCLANVQRRGLRQSQILSPKQPADFGRTLIKGWEFVEQDGPF